ncbi:bifunctional transcriptional activator/DNA repair enzyme AdaA [Candidatus Protochlamydia phocaeensis]|uniref:bifunctional transcriptional activator/DNA repair enzyme AdaA n=1 Tax=Candidatus Protochlamydia phocaeensis TaxID=1414722 RepID=UPI0008395B32|nr:trifunctional transcriptional activator/DNA repair protein Ada/methylated-DNA--[protein]-cysteine S-methyltransferase [Candidatus Protochlamydia phocaeensis]
MISEEDKQAYYRAFIAKKTEYEGVFFVGIKTTGIFCRPTCSAKKPKLENCEFFETTQQAIQASFRPCKRCRPLFHPQQASRLMQTLIEAIEQDPEKRWTAKDFAKLGADASTVRRQFKKRFGMTFIAYARARRIELALKQIQRGEPVIEAQLSTGYESGSGFRDAFSRLIGTAPGKLKHSAILKAAWLDTPLGPMIAMADENALYLLEFTDRRGLEREIARLQQKLHASILPGRTAPIYSIEEELKLYFDGHLTDFKTPLSLLGSPFQKKVWEELRRIPAGETRSYSDIALAIGKPAAVRAVALANGSNQLAIAIPCHRVIGINGALCGYAGGIARKKWLIHHEQTFLQAFASGG